MWFLFDIAVTVIDVLFFILILNAQMNLKKWVAKKHVLLYSVAFIAALMTYNQLTQNSITSVFLIIVFPLVYAHIFITGERLLKVFWVFLPLAILICVELLTISAVLAWYPDALFADISLSNLYRLQFAAINIAIRAAFFIFFLRAKFYLEKLGYRVFSLVGIPALNIAATFILVETLYNGLLLSRLAAFQVSLVVLVMNVIFLYFVHLLSKTNRILLEQKLEAQKRTLMYELTAQRRTWQQDLRMKKQDIKMKHHVHQAHANRTIKQFQQAVLDALSAFRDSLEDFQESGDAAEKHRILSERIEALTYDFNIGYCTGDHCIDTVLSLKADIAGRRHIKIETHANVPIGHPYQSNILSCILMMLMDHAVDTTNDVDAEICQKIIKMSIKMDDKCCVMITKNPVNPKVSLKSLKEGKQHVALVIAKKMAKSYDGGLRTTREAHNLTVTAFVPLNKKTRAEEFEFEFEFEFMPELDDGSVLEFNGSTGRLS